MILISQDAIRRHLTYEIASKLIENGFLNLRKGQMASGPRTVFVPGHGGSIIGFMPASDSMFTTSKIAAVSYENPKGGLDSHQGAVILFDKQSGKIQAILDATELTAIRTTAVTHLALKRILAPDDNPLSQVAVLGAGVQAFHHIKMLAAAFNIKNFAIISRDPARVARLQSRIGPDLRLAHRPYGSSLKDYPAIILATHGDEIILNLSQVSEDAKIFALGACRKSAQEVHPDILDRAVFIADSKRSVAESSGEGYYMSSKIPKNDVLDFGDLLAGDQETPSDQLVVFKSVGLAFQDLVCARYLFEISRGQKDILEVHDFGGALAY